MYRTVGMQQQQQQQQPHHDYHDDHSQETTMGPPSYLCSHPPPQALAIAHAKRPRDALDTPDHTPSGCTEASTDPHGGKRTRPSDTQSSSNPSSTRRSASQVQHLGPSLRSTARPNALLAPTQPPPARVRVRWQDLPSPPPSPPPPPADQCRLGESPSPASERGAGGGVEAASTRLNKVVLPMYFLTKEDAEFFARVYIGAEDETLARSRSQGDKGGAARVESITTDHQGPSRSAAAGTCTVPKPQKKRDPDKPWLVRAGENSTHGTLTLKCTTHERNNCPWSLLISRQKWNDTAPFLFPTVRPTPTYYYKLSNTKPNHSPSCVRGPLYPVILNAYRSKPKKPARSSKDLKNSFQAFVKEWIEERERQSGGGAAHRDRCDIDKHETTKFASNSGDVQQTAEEREEDEEDELLPDRSPSYPHDSIEEQRGDKDARYADLDGDFDQCDYEDDLLPPAGSEEPATQQGQDCLLEEHVGEEAGAGIQDGGSMNEEATVHSSALCRMSNIGAMDIDRSLGTHMDASTAILPAPTLQMGRLAAEREADIGEDAAAAAHSQAQEQAPIVEPPGTCRARQVTSTSGVSASAVAGITAHVAKSTSALGLAMASSPEMTLTSTSSVDRPTSQVVKALTDSISTDFSASAATAATQMSTAVATSSATLSLPSALSASASNPARAHSSKPSTSSTLRHPAPPRAHTQVHLEPQTLVVWPHNEPVRALGALLEGRYPGVGEWMQTVISNDMSVGRQESDSVQAPVLNLLGLVFVVNAVMTRSPWALSAKSRATSHPVTDKGNFLPALPGIIIYVHVPATSLAPTDADCAEATESELSGSDRESRVDVVTSPRAGASAGANQRRRILLAWPGPCDTQSSCAADLFEKNKRSKKHKGGPCRRSKKRGTDKKAGDRADVAESSTRADEHTAGWTTCAPGTSASSDGHTTTMTSCSASATAKPVRLLCFRSELKLNWHTPERFKSIYNLLLPVDQAAQLMQQAATATAVSTAEEIASVSYAGLATKVPNTSETRMVKSRTSISPQGSVQLHTLVSCPPHELRMQLGLAQHSARAPAKQKRRLGPSLSSPLVFPLAGELEPNSPMHGLSRDQAQRQTSAHARADTGIVPDSEAESESESESESDSGGTLSELWKPSADDVLLLLNHDSRLAAKWRLERE
ncbi:hypothetical protein BCV69DRAFT_130316 [Microstroma glucosiphilum]|uniref:Uncharacterized protein n=1 Tax=Pseudomicrostroma glucosiphilum TaxID=1684307 RepID=A0A316TWJ1_9BASI|nr:hypothetical protein BCV69DRAFT_130316 [Pseudomicrostroma glucosiphilum]PWN17697.1 hypothetical protein BCV69DRAFT_130316 [Pseudomicrostroma glucosiphilum]